MGYKVVAVGVGAASAYATRRLMQSVWKTSKGQDPPTQPGVTAHDVARGARVGDGVGCPPGADPTRRAAWRGGGVEGEDGELPESLEKVS